MKKTTSIISMSLLAASLIVPSVRAYADDDNPPGNHRQREALRQDQRELQELRDRRHDRTDRQSSAFPLPSPDRSTVRP